ncbi:MAG: ABC transporter ATP-binding protein [Acidimicrobiales bacterium]|nr:ABC transporter ATP-binding protein [Acidimicrobiales bacterium]
MSTQQVATESSASKPFVSCRGLVKRYGDRTVVDGVSFEIGVGETYGLLGPNGAGKTTTIAMVCGLLRPDDGEVLVAGHRMSVNALDLKGLIGLVPQDVALYPDLTGRENLRFFGRLHGIPKKRLDERIDEVLGVIGLTERADEPVDSYSGGMKRRCNIGVGLLHEPQLLILDEPTVGVDPQSRVAILEAIEALGGEGISILYTTHYMEEAERLCDRIGILDEGRMIAEGTRRELVERIGEHTRVKIEADGEGFEEFLGTCRALPFVVGESIGKGVVELLVIDARESLAPIVEAADHHGLHVGSVEVIEPDLESVFLHLTGKALRD